MGHSCKDNTLKEGALRKPTYAMIHLLVCMQLKLSSCKKVNILMRFNYATSTCRNLRFKC